MARWYWRFFKWVFAEVDVTIERVHQYYSQALREYEISSLNQELVEPPSKPFAFSIADLHQSTRWLKTNISDGHEKVSNKLIKSIPVSDNGFLFLIFNEWLIEKTYSQHWKRSTMILSVSWMQPISLQLVLAMSKSDASSSIFFDGWKRPLLVQQNNWDFASKSERKNDAYNFFTTSALLFLLQITSLVICIDCTNPVWPTISWSICSMSWRSSAWSAAARDTGTSKIDSHSFTGWIVRLRETLFIDKSTSTSFSW